MRFIVINTSSISLLVFGLVLSLMLVSCQGEKTEADNPLYSSYSEGPMDGYSWRNREIDYHMRDGKLTRKSLVSSMWVQGQRDGFNRKLVFFLDDVFKAGSDQGGVIIQGRYRIISGTEVELSIDSSYSDDYSREYLGSANTVVFSFTRNPDDFWFEDSLTGSSDPVTWYALGSEPPEGRQFEVQGVTVERTHQNYALRFNSKMRSGPGAEYPVVNIENPRGPDPEDMLEYIPAGDVVYGEAYTVDSYPSPLSEGVQAPWFYVSFPEFLGYISGWIFGGDLIPWQQNEEAMQQQWDRDTASEFQDLLDNSGY